MILENHGWLCSCGESFDEPEQFTGHASTMRRRGDSADHKPLGYCNLDTHEQALSWNFRVWKGQWKNQLDKKYMAGDLRSVVITEEGLGAGEEDDEDEDREEPGDIGETKEEPVAQSKKGKRSPIGGMVKVQFRPKVFDMDESVVHLYNLFLGSMRRAGIPYEPSIGEWIRDVLFQHYFEHPEIIDLSSLLTPAEKEALMTVKREEQYARVQG